MHNLFTFMAKVDPSRVSAVQAYLAQVQAAAGNHPHWPFKSLTKVHFASMLVIADLQPGFEPYLVFENNIDGTIASYIEQLCSVAPIGVHTMFSQCTDYGSVNPTSEYLRSYLHDHVLRPDASFVGNVGRDVARIRREATLVENLETSADPLGAASRGPSPRTVYDALRAAVERDNPWALQPKGRLSRREIVKRKFRRASFFATIALSLLVVPAVVTALALWLGLRWHESNDVPDTILLKQADLAKLTIHEDSLKQNHLASISLVKPGLFRQLTLRLILLFINRTAALQVNGTLSNLTNIHFAHWVLIDGGRRLMFLTNYDGSWENYLDDFIDSAAPALTAIWSNAQGFPKTNSLVNGGAKDERFFKNIVRKTQVPTAVFYSAYDLTVPTIDNNSAIRDGLATNPPGDELDRLLQRL